MNPLNYLLSKDLRILYSIIYTDAQSIDSNLAAAFLAFNSLHMHGEAIYILRRLLSESSSNVNLLLSDSPLYSLLIPIVAEEYGAKLLNGGEFSIMFRLALNSLIDVGNESIIKCLELIPSNYMLGHLRKLKTDRSAINNIQQVDEFDCLLKLIEDIYPDHFVSARSYLIGLIDSYRHEQSNEALGIPVDSTFFRTFGHSIFQPDWLAREFSIASQFISGCKIVPFFVSPHKSSLLGFRNTKLSNQYILDGWIETFKQHQEYGRFLTIDEIGESYDANVRALFPYEYSLSELLGNDSLVTFNETGSSVYEKTKHVIDLDLGCSINSIGRQSLSSPVSKRKTAILHVRSSAFYGDHNNRNSDIAKYSSLCDYLYEQGYEIYNYSNPDLPNNSMNSVFNYNSFKSKKLDALIVSSADLIVSTPSGIGGTGRLFGAREIVTNFWPYFFDGVPSQMSVMPKLVVELETGKIIGLEEVISMKASFGTNYFDESDKYEIRENSESDLLFAIQDFLNGRMLELNTLLKGTNAIAPESFLKRYFPLEL